MTKLPSFYFAIASCIILGLTGCAAQQASSPPKPLRILLVSGGCCHDYATQKEILKKAIESRINATVDQSYSDETTTTPHLPILGNPDYAKGYDLVIHDECGSGNNDPAIVKGVLKPHWDGLPAVNLHCANHSYRIGNPNDPVTNGTPHGYWFEYLGVQSSAHGPQEPIAIHYTDTNSPITQGLSDWTTIHEEHYNNIHVFDSTHVLARGVQKFKQKGVEKQTDWVVIWTNTYGPKKARVFSTTIGHNNETVEDARYLDLVMHGILWATQHLDKDGSPAKGYGPHGM